MREATRRKTGAIAVIITALFVAGFFILSSRSDVSPTEIIGPAQIVTYSTDTPDERKPDEAGYVWQGQGTDPKRITIEKLGIDGLIQNVGVDQNTQIAVPNNVHIAGWFVDSMLPGDKGLSIIDGHINGPTVDEGIFRRLPELVEGDTVTITFGDNSTKTFMVKTNSSVKTADSASILFSKDPSIDSQLNLITCSGNFDPETNQYDERQITSLELVD